MLLTSTQTVIMVISVAFGVLVTRFTPFLLFPEVKEPPKVITYLGQVLPSAMMGLLVIYCLKDVSLQSPSHGFPELISIIVVLVVHKWKNNVLLSIGSGTILYMFIVQTIFN